MGSRRGDPVGFWDPFGLCPAHLVQADGTRPGGMSHDEYYRFEDMINSGYTSAGAAALNGILQSGRIVTNQPMVGPENRVQVVHHPDTRPSYIRIGPAFWDEGEAAAAWTLAHDYGTYFRKPYWDSSTVRRPEWISRHGI